MRYRSHTKEKTEEARERGEKIWELDTGEDGEDDVLIGGRDEVLGDVGHFADIIGKEWGEDSDLPGGWTLRELTELEA